MFGALNNDIAGSHTEQEWNDVQIAQGFLCFYCGWSICKKSIDPDLEATKDHLLAQSRRGSDFSWNIVAACAQCNRLKGSKLPGEFLRERWAFARAVQTAAQQSTGIPLLKGRDKSRSYVDDAEEAQGIFVKAWMDVANPTGQMLRYLSKERRMPDETEDAAFWNQRRRMLAQQVQSIGRRFLEAAGQMQLALDLPSSVKKPVDTVQTDEAALTVKGLHVTERKA